VTLSKLLKKLLPIVTVSKDAMTASTPLGKFDLTRIAEIRRLHEMLNLFFNGPVQLFADDFRL
jgi:hypothetical protein